MRGVGSSWLRVLLLLLLLLILWKVFAFTAILTMPPNVCGMTTRRLENGGEVERSNPTCRRDPKA